MEPDRLHALVEAILITSRGPVRAEDVVAACADEGTDLERVREVLAALREACDRPDRGIRLEQVAGGWRYVTEARLDGELRTFHGLQQRHRLSQAALEVLAIVAHREPVTQPEINFIRGTNSAGVVRNLLDRKLLRVAGRKNVVGKPFLYRTSRDFLIHFGLDRIEELPDPEELAPETDIKDTLSD